MTNDRKMTLNRARTLIFLSDALRNAKRDDLFAAEEAIISADTERFYDGERTFMLQTLSGELQRRLAP